MATRAMVVRRRRPGFFSRRRSPSVGVSRRARAVAIVRRGAGAAARTAAREKTMLSAVIAAAGLAYIESKGYEIPQIETLGLAGTYGLAAFMAGRMMKNRMVADAAVGLLCVATYQFVGKQVADVEGGATSGSV